MVQSEHLSGDYMPLEYVHKRGNTPDEDSIVADPERYHIPRYGDYFLTRLGRVVRQLEQARVNNCTA